jgi:hypothetical protein
MKEDEEGSFTSQVGDEELEKRVDDESFIEVTDSIDEECSVQ